MRDKLDKLLEDMLFVAHSEFERIYGIDVSQKFEDNHILPAEMTKIYAQVISLATMIQYHDLLRKRLLTHGIDIGKL